jgi:hypothetical protein
MPAPKIDQRSYEQIVAETEELVQGLTSWRPGADVDAGGALIRIFGHFAEIVVERLNQVPDKSFLAFLNLIGADMTPAQPARVPLTFQLAAGSPVDAFVPAGTQAAAPPVEKGDAEVVFETEQDLLVTRTQLAAVYVRAFDKTRDQDRYGHYTAAATGLADTPFSLFAGDQEMVHYLYLACEALLNLAGPTEVTLQFQTAAAQQLQALPIAWAYWDGDNKIWQPFAEGNVTAQVSGEDTYLVSLQACPPLKAGPVNGVKGGWLRGQLNLPLPPAQEALTLDSIAIDKPTAYEMPYFPFAQDGKGTYFFLGGEAAFLRRGATVNLDVTLQTPGQGGNMGLKLEYYTAPAANQQAWRELPIEDGTKGFTQNGRIRFQIPPDASWSITGIQDWTSRWCRITKTGTYTAAPQLRSIAVSNEWDLPVIGSVVVKLPADRPPLPAYTGFYNSQTLDLSKDFYPFGEAPGFNDTFYLAYGQIVSQLGTQAGDKVSLDVTLTTPGKAGGSDATEPPPVTLIWEFWNGRRWETLGQSDNTSGSTGVKTYNFQDSTQAFTGENGAVEFDLPAGVAVNVVNGVEDHWLRVRLISGDYGHAAGYEPYTIPLSGAEGTSITAYKLVEANFAPPIVTSLNFDVSSKLQFPLSSCQAYNDFTYEDYTQANADAKGSFTPFGPTLDGQPTLYLGFDQPFDNRSVTLYAQVLPPTPEQVLPNEFQDKVYDDPPQLVWEYATQDGWARLGVVDETKAFADRGLVRFIGPRHFSSRQRFGRDLYWLRVRWQGGQFTIFPQGQRLRLNTIWAAQTTTLENEPLGSGNGNPNQTFQTVRQPVQPGQRLEVREMELSDTDLEQLQAEQAVTIVRDSAGNIDEIWVQWQEVRDFYTSGPADRHYTLDHLTGRVQFGDGKRGMLPPVGTNNIRLAFYRSGGGAAGNRAAETIVQLKSTIPYVGSAINYEPAAGGTATQSLDSVERYGPRTLRHRGRAVTAQDIEDLAFAASSAVARAKAIPPRFQPLDLWLDPGSQAPDMAQHRAVEEAGRVGLIIVPDSDAPRPVPGPELLDRVRSSLLSCMGSTADLWISGPDWMEVTVSAAIVPTSLTAANFVGEQVVAALEQFLHPLTGGFEGKGWEFGRQPYRSDLYAVIEGVEGVDYVRTLTVTETPEAGQLPAGQFLIYSGQHEIDVILEGL